MFVYTNTRKQNQKQIINLNIFPKIYCGGENKNSIRTTDTNLASHEILATYNTAEEAQTALEILVDRIRYCKDNAVFMPTIDEVKAKLAVTNSANWHHAKGKKTKGHGGS